MPKSVINPQVIKFSIAVIGVRLSRPDQDALEDLVTRYIRILIEDLGIPAKFGLSLRVSQENSEASPSSLKVSIHGKKCRVPFSLNITDGGNEVLASKIMAVIHQNRDLLINRPITRLIRETYIHEANSSLRNLTLHELHQLIVTIVKHGFSLHRLEGFRPGPNTTGWNKLHYFDSIIEAVDATNIRVTYNAAYHELNAQTAEGSLNEMSSLMQDGLFYELGLAFPQIKWKDDESLEDNEFQIQINDVNYPSAWGLKPGEVLVNDTVGRLSLLNIEGKPAINPANGIESAIVDVAYADICQAAGLTTWNPLGYLILYLSQQLRQKAGSFLTKDVVENDLRSLGMAFPSLVDTVLSQYDLFTLTWILRELLDEELSIRDLRSILDNLLLINGTTRADLSRHIVIFPEGAHLVPSDQDRISDLNFTDLASYIRTTALKRYVSHRYSRDGSTLVVYLLDPEIENRVRESKGRKLSEAERNEIINAVYREVGYLPPTAQNPVILTTTDVRRPFRKLIEVENPHLAVLCYQELSPDLNIQPIARIVT